jgi:hypothetical protein
MWLRMSSCGGWFDLQRHLMAKGWGPNLSGGHFYHRCELRWTCTRIFPRQQLLPGLGDLRALCRILPADRRVSSCPKFYRKVGCFLYHQLYKSIRKYLLVLASSGKRGCKSFSPQLFTTNISSHSPWNIFFKLFQRSRQWMDFMHRQQDDFCSVRGFVLSIRDTLRVKKGGMLWCGHPCGPFLANTIVWARAHQVTNCPPMPVSDASAMGGGVSWSNARMRTCMFNNLHIFYTCVFTTWYLLPRYSWPSNIMIMGPTKLNYIHGWVKGIMYICLLIIYIYVYMASTTNARMPRFVWVLAHTGGTSVYWGTRDPRLHQWFSCFLENARIMFFSICLRKPK